MSSNVASEPRCWEGMAFQVAAPRPLTPLFRVCSMVTPPEMLSQSQVYDPTALRFLALHPGTELCSGISQAVRS